jgi:hypothetical protein
METKRTFGFAHDTDRTPGPGDLAWFCIACPQPGFNLPENWRELEQSVLSFISHCIHLTHHLFRWRFMIRLVMDGNFKADHMIMKNPRDDVWLMDGEAYFVPRAAYQKHIETAVTKPQVKSHICCV